MEIEPILAESLRRDSPWHGEKHWRCVAATGLELVAAQGAGDRHVVFVFGLLHDTRRHNETYDPEHGRRATAFARDLHRSGALGLTDAQLETLCHACDLHSDGLTTDDPTVGACWDADRLHLPRVGIDPDPARFSTAVAHDAGRLERAAVLRDAPPEWQALLTLAGLS